MDFRERAALDRHITGNYGEDQFKDDCCGENLPEFSGTRQEGDTYLCMKCGREWQWAVDESEGGFWEEII